MGREIDVMCAASFSKEKTLEVIVAMRLVYIVWQLRLQLFGMQQLFGMGEVIERGDFHFQYSDKHHGSRGWR